MNQKLCKRLRKLAREQTVGAPHTAYLLEKEHPKQYGKVEVLVCTARLRPDCTRAYYKAAKLAARRLRQALH